jgi:hypothetical protein
MGSGAAVEDAIRAVDLERAQRPVDSVLLPLRALWSAVLSLALMDYQYGLRRQVVPPADPYRLPGITAGARLRRRERILDWERNFTMSRAWLHGKLETVGSFIWVCDVLDVDHCRVRKIADDPALFERMKRRVTEETNRSEVDDEEVVVVGYVEHHVGVPAGGQGYGERPGDAAPDEGGEDSMD